MSASAVIDKMLDILGPNGEHWTKGDFFDPQTERYCIVGALGAAEHELHNKRPSPVGVKPSGSPPTTNGWQLAPHRISVLASNFNGEAFRAIKIAVEEYAKRSSIVGFNDCGDTTFSDVRTVLEKARASLQEAGK